MAGTRGNTNALKHGLYAQHYDPHDRAELHRMAPDDFRHELYLMRAVVANIYAIHRQLHRLVQEKLALGEPADVEGLAKITNSLSLAVTALNTTARTYAVFNGRDALLNDALDQALDDMPIFLDEKPPPHDQGQVGLLGLADAS